MSAEDELCTPAERPLPEGLDPAELAKFWDDTESYDANVRIIGWWLVRHRTRAAAERGAQAGAVDER